MVYVRYVAHSLSLITPFNISIIQDCFNWEFGNFKNRTAMFH